MHRDLKPQNIIFEKHKKCSVKILDFGEAVEFQEGINQTEIKGTAWFISPQVA